MFDLIQYVGGDNLVRNVFKSLARMLSCCVVFINEIDSLFGARMSSHKSGGAFTEFMPRTDGLCSGSQNTGVTAIVVTNGSFDLGDAALFLADLCIAAALDAAKAG